MGEKEHFGWTGNFLKMPHTSKKYFIQQAVIKCNNFFCLDGGSVVTIYFPYCIDCTLSWSTSMIPFYCTKCYRAKIFFYTTQPAVESKNLVFYYWQKFQQTNDPYPSTDMKNESCSHLLIPLNPHTCFQLAILWPSQPHTLWIQHWPHSRGKSWANN